MNTFVYYIRKVGEELNGYNQYTPVHFNFSGTFGLSGPKLKTKTKTLKFLCKKRK